MLSIGDFARYAGVSVRMLRHYDALGLLTPTCVDPVTGYRSYAPELLARANGLVALKDLGFSLDQVGTLLDRSLDPVVLREMLDVRRRELEGQIEQDRTRLADVERRLRLMEGERTMELEFVEKQLPEVTLTQLSDHVAEAEEVGSRVGPLFEQLVHRIEENGGHATHPGVAWYSGSGEGMDIATGFPDAGDVPGTEQGTLTAEPRAVTAVYHGAMTHIGDAWQALAAHVQKAGLEFAGPCREVYLQTSGPQETWVTELQQPVR
jgi:DNA-binding transcriptional MerR regulator